jgi:predicted phage terminase large subunit-like protein
MMEAFDRQLINLALRNDLAAFIQRCFQTVVPGQRYEHNWHIEAIAHHLTLAFQRKIKRLIITLPPRNLKSISASVAFPAWALGLDPKLRIVCASYSQDLALKHARDCRSIMEINWYRRSFPGTRIDPRKNTEAEFMTTAKGYRLSTSVGGTLTGRGGSIVIIDDPLKPADAMSASKREAVKQWYDGTLCTRLDNKKDDVIIVIMQRLHVDDFVAHILEKEEWVHLDLPAIAPVPQEIPVGPGDLYSRQKGDLLHTEREPLSVLEQLKASMGSQAFSAQYQQSPVPEGGALIKWFWFRSYRDLPGRRTHDKIVQSWDTASKADELHDYSVCTTWLVQDNDYYLVHVLREHLDYPGLKKRVIQHAQAHRVDSVIIEDKGSGTHLIQDLRSDRSVRPIPFKPDGDKITRMAAEMAIIEAGQVWVPESAAWLADFQTEIMQFPYGRHDDQVDSVSQFLAWQKKRGYRRSCSKRSTGW